ncbi:hypothetical protein [Saccharicrinis sp. 156]|uniref:hypothetical protein n=1 Tax=Saccharicrinis sp. 156 TaxID=3417574 RepID=UPI003D32FE72
MEREFTEKKIYSKPQLEIIDVDHEISLMMVSDGDPPPPPIVGGVNSTSSPSPLKSTAPSAVSNPFGSSTPDYSN